MVLCNVEYWTKNAGDGYRNLVEDKRLGGILGKIRLDYEDNITGVGSSVPIYLINGGLVTPGAGYCKLEHETEEGLVALAKRLGLPAPEGVRARSPEGVYASTSRMKALTPDKGEEHEYRWMEQKAEWAKEYEKRLEKKGMKNMKQ